MKSIQGVSQTKVQKSQGDRWLLVHVCLDNCWVQEKLGFQKKIVKSWVLVKIYELKIYQSMYITR